MLNSWSGLALALLSSLASANQLYFGSSSNLANSIAEPGQPQYYLLADAGTSVAPNDELKRTNRSLFKWWEDLFPQNNNCCNNNNNNLLNNGLNNGLYNGLNNLNFPPSPNCNYGLQLQPEADPKLLKKWFKKLPDLWGNNNCPCNNCQQQPSYGGDIYAPPPPPPASNSYEAPPSAPYEAPPPAPAYDGPGDGDAGYAAPPPAAPPAIEDNYVPAPPPPPVTYEAPAPSYEPAAEPAPSYEPAKGNDYPAKSYGETQPAAPPQIVYQPIIYLSAAAPAQQQTTQPEQQQSYQPPPPAAPQPPAPPPAYAAAPPPACNSPAGYLPLVGLPFYNYGAAPCQAPPAPAPAPAPPTPSYTSSSCPTPIRLSLVDQPYRVAPELFDEYNYRLSLAESHR